jgi:hypothetical protein
VRHETDQTGASLPDSEDGRQWVRISLVPEFRLLITAVVGARTCAAAQKVVTATKARVAGIPAFFSGGCTCSLAALIAAFHVGTTLVSTGKPGRPRKPVCAPHPELIYGQVVKQKQQGQLLTLRTRVVLGAERLTQHSLGRTGQPDLASGLGAVGAQDLQFLQRPRAPATAGGLLPSLLQCGQTAYRCCYDWRTCKVKDLRDGVFYPTRYASLQGVPLPLDPHASLMLYRPQSGRHPMRQSSRDRQ